MRSQGSRNWMLVGLRVDEEEETIDSVLGTSGVTPRLKAEIRDWEEL